MKKIFCLFALLAPWNVGAQLKTSTSGTPIRILPNGSALKIMHPQIDTTNHLLHYWNFNTSTSLTALFTPTVGNGSIIYTASANGAATAIPTTGNITNNFELKNVNARNGDAAGTHLRFNNPQPNAALTLSVPTNGYGKIVLKYATRRSSVTAATMQIIAHSIDGTTFIQDTSFTPVPVVGSLSASDTINMSYFDFSNKPGVNNNANFKVRFTFSGSQPVPSGNHRFDNITIESGGYTPPIIPVDTTPQWVKPTITRFGAKNDILVYVNKDIDSILKDVEYKGGYVYILKYNGVDSVFSDDTPIDSILMDEVKTRGYYSDYPTHWKKQYAFKTASKVSWFGMPSSDDWILNGNGVDEVRWKTAVADSMMRRDSVIYTERVSRFFDCIIVGKDVASYRGGYVMQEKYGRDVNRIDIGTGQAGAFLLEKGRQDDPTDSFYYNPRPDRVKDIFATKYVKAKDLTPAIRAKVENLIFTQLNPVFDDTLNFASTVWNYFDKQKFAYFIAVSEMHNGPDTYEVGSYFSRKDSNSKIEPAIIRDFDNLGYLANKPRSFREDGNLSWIKSMMLLDPSFYELVRETYTHLRINNWNTSTIQAIQDYYHDSYTSTGIQARDFAKWGYISEANKTATDYTAARNSFRSIVYPGHWADLDKEFYVEPKTPLNIYGYGDSNIIAKWDTVMGMNTYDLQVVTDTNSMAGLQAFSVPGNQDRYTIPGMTNESAYFIRVRSNRNTFPASSYSRFVRVVPHTIVPAVNDSITWQLLGGSSVLSNDTLYMTAGVASFNKAVDYTTDSVIAHISYYYHGTGLRSWFEQNPSNTFDNTQASLGISFYDGGGPIQSYPFSGTNYTNWLTGGTVDIYLTQTGVNYHTNGIFQFTYPYSGIGMSGAYYFKGFPITVKIRGAGAAGQRLSSAKITGGNIINRP